MSRAPGVDREVTPLELFFDLVYVFAIGQLSHHLVEHVDLRTGAETGVLSLAVFYAWYMTAWGANWLEPDRLPVHAALVGLMFASLLMSVAIGDAFGDRAWLFVTGYLLLQVGRTTFLIVALWAAATVATYAGAWSLHWVPGRGRRVDIEHTEIAAGHLIERFRLFFIIVLGETVLTMGSSFAGTPFEPARLFALVIGFTGTVALPRSSSSAWQPGATHAPDSWVSSRWRYSPPPRPH